VWSSYDSFFGHSWVWNALEVFGGRRGLYGNLTRLATGPIVDRTSSPNVTYAGFGTTPEAIEEIPIVFDLIWEMNWRSEYFDVGQWVQQYAVRRYGAASPSISAAMAILLQAAYNNDIDESPIENGPTFTAFSSRNTNATGLLEALRLFVAAGKNGEVDPSLGPYQYGVCYER
jgi:alpha-N-acetylglucosaminidase